MTVSRWSQATAERIRRFPFAFNEWLGSFPSTNGRVFLSLLMAAATAATYLSGVIIAILRTPPGTEVKTWTPDLEWLGFLTIWAGLDWLQYMGKRTTDAAYVAAKQGGNGHSTPGGGG